MRFLDPPKIAILLMFVIVLGVPFLFRPGEARLPDDATRIVIISPHNELIRAEFSRAFLEWSRRELGEPVVIDWRVPGGTSEILKQLEAEYEAALRNGPIQPESMSYDLLFGGGSYVHNQTTRPLTTRLPSLATFQLPVAATLLIPAGREGPEPPDLLAERPYPIQLRLPDRASIILPATGAETIDSGLEWKEVGVTVPIGTEIEAPKGSLATSPIATPTPFRKRQLDDWYGLNEIGRNTLYDPDLYWFGTALSAFGIVYNRDVLASLEIQTPRTWSDLTNPRLAGWVAMGDPGQSGSLCTTYEVILNMQGWREGWRILREASANSRYFANSSSKVPIDVSIGEAAAGVCIDFYGRSQAQTIADAGDPDRVAYVDPRGLTDIDPDPVTMLRGARHADLAQRFIEFCLSVEAQSLWQFPVDEVDKGDRLGPNQFEVRRMPVRRMMYEKYFDRFIDQVNPFELAEPMENWNSDIRRTIAPLFSAMAIDNHQALREAWTALQSIESDHPRRREMYELFHSMPAEPVPLQTSEALDELEARWKSEDGDQLKERDRIAWTTFFRRNYERVVETARKERAAIRP